VSIPSRIMMRVDLERAMLAVSERERRTGCDGETRDVFGGFRARGDVSRRSLSECSRLQCGSRVRRRGGLRGEEVQSRTPLMSRAPLPADCVKAKPNPDQSFANANYPTFGPFASMHL